MEEMKLGLVKRFVYAFTCLFGSKEEIMEILPSKIIEKEVPIEKELIKEEESIQTIKSDSKYTLGVMDRFCLIKVDGKLLDGFVSIISKGNHPVVKQDLIILDLKNMIGKKIFFENTNSYGKIFSMAEDFIVVYMIDTSAQLQNMITSFKFEPEIIHVQEKDIGIHRPMKGNNFIDFIGVNMNAIKNSYLRWTKEWPLISSMVKKN